ncbi:MAG TPA: hypothetical protein VM869_25615 [Enhygromyxa sp.]|nr:hypothetical protein [Enhygromyxa sp.]
MHDHLRHLIIGSSLVLGACELEAETELEQPALGQPTEHDAVDEIASSSEAELRLIDGLDPDCVDVNGPIIVRIDPYTTTCEFDGFATFDAKWDHVTLFEAGSPMLQALGATLPLNSPLREFCRYEYVGPASSREAAYIDFMGYLKGVEPPEGVDGDGAAIDCPVIAPMTDQGLDTAAGREALHEAFMANIHALSAADMANVVQREMRFVLLDTVDEGVAPYNEHGLHLEQLIADIACPASPATCLSWIKHVLVMPRKADEDYSVAHWNDGGGDIGYVNEFSAQLVYGLLDWAGPNLLLPINQRTRLVMSAAVGADPNHPIATDPDYAPGQSMIDALEAAYCMGAVVYAAAGNTRDSSCPNAETQMLAPANLESFAVPTAAQCSSWGYAPDRSPVSTYTVGTPLIHAMGGLDGNDRDIANQREDAHPRMHATASGAVHSNGSGAMTGTSVAAAVGAAAHFLRWTINPNIPGAYVARRFYNTGHDIGEVADSGMYVTQPIRRLAICQGMSDLLPLTCAPLPPDPHGNLDDYALAIEDAIADADFAGLLLPEEPISSPLVGDQPDCSEGPALDVFVKPQPDRPVCAYCEGTVGGGGAMNAHMLNMSIASEQWASDLEVTGAYLHVYAGDGSTTTFNLADVVDEINDAVPANVIQVPFTFVAPIAASLEFSYYDALNDRYVKQANPIPLLWPM